MRKYQIIQNHFLPLIENEAFTEWEHMPEHEKSIYKDRYEFAEIRYRECIHRLAVEKGLMK